MCKGDLTVPPTTVMVAKNAIALDEATTARSLNTGTEPDTSGQEDGKAREARK